LFIHFYVLLMKFLNQTVIFNFSINVIFFNYYDFIPIFLTASTKNLSCLLFIHFYVLLMKFLNQTVIFNFSSNVIFLTITILSQLFSLPLPKILAVYYLSIFTCYWWNF
jgi:hypothetical protein